MEKIIITTKYMKTIGIILIAMVFSIALQASAQTADEVWADNSWSNTDNGTWADNSWGNDEIWADNSWSNTDNGTWADNSWSNDNGYHYEDVITTTETTYYAPTYSYGYGNSYYPTTPNYVGVGLVAPIVGYQPNNSYVFPTTPNYVTPTLTVVQPTYTQPTYVQPTYYTQPVTSTYVPNQVLAYNDTNPSLDSVYLSDVPYTGFSDYYGIIIFISILLTFSATLAYVFLKRKIAEKMSFVSVYAGKSEDTNDVMKSDFINQITSDKSDIREVEEYARSKKVLLSTDASARLVKIQRLGEGNAKDIIDNLSGNEWIAIGESDL